MFRVQSNENGKSYRLAVFGLSLLSAAALAVTIWVMVDFLREQEIVDELIRKLPSDAREPAKVLAGELKWQFRLTILVMLNLVVTGFAMVLLWRAYRSSQESLRDIKAMADDILGSMDQAVITTDVRGNVTSINQRGLELLSPPRDCIGRPLSELSSDVPLAEFREDWMVERSVAMTRDFHTTINGAERTLRAFCQTLSDLENHEIGNVLQLRDVTARVLIEDRMRRMERYMGLGSLAAGLHHEIKNPLAALSLHVQLLDEHLEERDRDEEARQMIGVIKAEVTRIGGVLESFRDFASLGQLNLTSVDVEELLRRQTELLLPRAAQQGIQIELSCDGKELKTVWADAGRLEQVLLNLLLNAMEAMPGGGKLGISATVLDGAARIDIADSGRGIPQDLRDKVFDPYFTTKSDGTGLGLAFCDKIMREHQGGLEFQSSSHGTTFHLTLPLGRRDALAKQ
ncbi:MAG: PAS domain-containing protein [Planctomycetales bacterium]|nr:PAS domain-containing protein [Planctomycetales bacterium]